MLEKTRDRGTLWQRGMFVLFHVSHERVDDGFGRSVRRVGGEVRGQRRRRACCDRQAPRHARQVYLFVADPRLDRCSAFSMSAFDRRIGMEKVNDVPWPSPLEYA